MTYPGYLPRNVQSMKMNIDFILHEASYFDGYRRDDLIEYHEECFPYRFNPYTEGYEYAGYGSYPCFSDSGIKRTPSRDVLKGIKVYTGLVLGALINIKGEMIDPDREPERISEIVGVSLSHEYNHGDIVYLKKNAEVKDTIFTNIRNYSIWPLVEKHLDSLGIACIRSAIIIRPHGSGSVSSGVNLHLTQGLSFIKNLPDSREFTLNERGYFEVEVAGGVPPYSYNWHVDKQEHFAGDNAPGLYVTFPYVQIDTLYVVVTDSVGTSISSNICTTETSDPTKLTFAYGNPGDMLMNGTYEFHWIGGKPPYSISNLSDLTAQPYITQSTRFNFKASDYPLGIQQIIIESSDGLFGYTEYFHVYGATPKVKELEVTEGDTIDVRTLFDESNHTSFGNYVSAHWVNGGSWTGEWSYTFSEIGNHTIWAGYYHKDDSASTLIPGSWVSIPVTVKARTVSPVNAKQPTMMIHFGEHMAASSAFEFANSDQQYYVFSSSDSDIASVGLTGTITAHNIQGQTTITATHVNDSSTKASFILYVNPKP